MITSNQQREDKPAPFEDTPLHRWSSKDWSSHAGFCQSSHDEFVPSFCGTPWHTYWNPSTSLS